MRRSLKAYGFGHARFGADSLTGSPAAFSRVVSLPEFRGGVFARLPYLIRWGACELTSEQVPLFVTAPAAGRREHPPFPVRQKASRIGVASDFLSGRKIAPTPHRVRLRPAFKTGRFRSLVVVHAPAHFQSPWEFPCPIMG